jgi:hypothetical protein
MSRVAALVPLVLCAALASCAPAGNDQRSKDIAPTNEPVPTECTAVTTRADTLATITGRLTAGDATVNQVRSAAADLVTAFDNATAATGPGLHHASQAVQRVEEAATTHPVDTQALHDATGDLLTALDKTPNACKPSTKNSPA